MPAATLIRATTAHATARAMVYALFVEAGAAEDEYVGLVEEMEVAPGWVFAVVKFRVAASSCSFRSGLCRQTSKASSRAVA